MQIVENVYSRSKSVWINDKAEEELLLFAGLHVITAKHINGKRVFEKVKIVVSHLVESKVTESPKEYLAMPNHELRVLVDDEEFEKLKYISEKDIERFYTYVPKPREGYDLEILNLD